LDFSELIARISTDEKRRCTVEAFRQELKDLPPLLRPRTMERLPRICPGKVIRRRRDGSQQTAYTGIVLLELDNLARPEEKRQMKDRAMSWPTTFAVLEGANGNSIDILVRGTFEDGTLPSGDSEQSERFHQELYKRCATVYASVLGRSPKAKEAHFDDTFIWTYDPSPYFDSGAAAVKVSRSLINTGLDARQEDAQEYGPESSRPSVDNNNLWRRRFALAVSAAKEKSLGEEKSEPELEAVALEALRLDIPQEDTVKQASWSVRWRNIDREKQRAIIESVYLEHSDQQGRNRSHSMQEVTYRLQTFMQSRYDLRFNVLTNGVEWRRNDAASFVFQPLDSRVMNTMIQECHERGLDVFDRDMKRYLGSTRIRDYNVAHAYLNELDMTWDGMTDYIGALADRVPCRNPHWREWFHTWFLGMVAQWSGDSMTHGNSVVPLLIGQQGCGKSTFGQLLLPPELREAGYRELVDFTSKQDAERMLTTSLLINLDEFNQISEKIQQGFLKNLIQKSNVKGRRPFSSVMQNMPRYASFIATTNMSDVLSDPSGSRRFIVADIRDGAVIDNKPPFNYQRLYAQALAELKQGRRHYFTPAEVQQIETYNATYGNMRPEVSRFLDVFEPLAHAKDGGKKMKLSDITKAIKLQTGYEYSDKGFNYLGRWLTNEARSGRLRRTISNGCPHYLLHHL
jgi:predicted P-loop ATPase